MLLSCDEVRYFWSGLLDVGNWLEVIVLCRPITWRVGRPGYPRFCNSSREFLEDATFLIENNIFEKLLAELRRSENDRIQNAIVDMALLLEGKRALTLTQQNKALDTLVSTFENTSIDNQSSIIWAIGKSEGGHGALALRRLFPLLIQINSTELFWQALVSYENLVGHRANGGDRVFFEIVRDAGCNDGRISEAIGRVIGKA